MDRTGLGLYLVKICSLRLVLLGLASRVGLLRGFGLVGFGGRGLTPSRFRILGSKWLVLLVLRASLGLGFEGAEHGTNFEHEQQQRHLHPQRQLQRLLLLLVRPTTNTMLILLLLLLPTKYHLLLPPA